MPIANAQPLTFRATGLSDANDASSAFPGAMNQLKDLIPNPSVRGQFLPRPAATQLTNFSGFTTPGQVEALFVVGTRAYGMVASARNANKSEPFCYDLVGGAFVTISGVTAGNSPTSQGTTGDWTPCTMAMVGNRIVITHPGYNGTTTFIGWIDVRNFTSNTITGTTHTSTLIDTLSASPLAAGWEVGDLIAGTGIPANTHIVSMTATSVTLSAATTSGGAGVTLTVTSGTTAAPMYGAGQTNISLLLGVPVAVAQYNGRAWYAVNNTLQFSDALNPLNITLASQSVTCGDNTVVNAVQGLPLSNAYQGGVVQSLIAFKGDALYYQITGDIATLDLKVNAVTGSVGTLAPNSVVATPKGLAYIAPDGLRFVDPISGMSSDPIGSNGSGVNLPFLYAVNPSRIAAAFDKNLYRVSVQNGFKDGQPNEEYWFDLFLQIWTGPHSFPAALIAPYHVSVNNFVMVGVGINAKLWSSKAQISSSSTYTENGVAMSWIWQPTLLPDNEAMAANQVVESTLGLVMPSTQSTTVLALDENGNALDTISMSGNGAGGAIWNSFTWGTGVWGGLVMPYQEYTMPWHNPLVFKQMTIRMVGQSQSGFSIGNLRAKVQPLGYVGGHTL